MLKIEKYLTSNKIKIDELGRIIIEDLNILEKINAASAGNPQFLVPDVGCGNSNCVC